jgi:hypothetical protein
MIPNILSDWDSFYEESEWGFLNHFPKYYMTILLGDFNVKLGRKYFQIDNWEWESTSVRIVIFALSKNLVVKRTMFQHRNIHKYIWTSPDGNTRNQIDHILIVRRWYSSILDVRNFSIGWVIKSRRLRWAGHVARMGERHIQGFGGETWG